MDFALNDEQQMLQESARRFLQNHHPLSRARQALPWSDAAQSTLWASMAEMGWTSLLVSDSQGGLGLGLTEAALIAEEAGRQLLNLPFASSAVLLAYWLSNAGSTAPNVLREAVEAIMAGTRAFHCIAEGDAWWDFSGQCSDWIIVRGWHDGNVPLQIAVIDANTAAATPALDPTLRQCAAQQVALEWHTITLTGEERERARAAYRLMIAAELVGVGQAALDASCNYAKDRSQFGKPIGSYQAIKHQLANAWIGIDNARLSMLYATSALDNTLPDWPFSCAVAEFTAIEGAFQSTRTAIQTHGGIGFTWEHDAHLYLKRAQHLAARLGGASSVLTHIENLALG